MARVQGKSRATWTAGSPLPNCPALSLFSDLAVEVRSLRKSGQPTHGSYDAVAEPRPISTPVGALPRKPHQPACRPYHKLPLAWFDRMLKVVLKVHVAAVAGLPAVPRLAMHVQRGMIGLYHAEEEKQDEKWKPFTAPRTLRVTRQIRRWMATSSDAVSIPRFQLPV